MVIVLAFAGISENMSTPTYELPVFCDELLTADAGTGCVEVAPQMNTLFQHGTAGEPNVPRVMVISPLSLSASRPEVRDGELFFVLFYHHDMYWCQLYF